METTFYKSITNPEGYSELDVVAHRLGGYLKNTVHIYSDGEVLLMSPETATQVANALLAAVASLNPAPEHHTGSITLTGAGNE